MRNTGSQMNQNKFYKTSYGHVIKFKEKNLAAFKILTIPLLAAAFTVLCIFYNFEGFQLNTDYFRKTVLGIVLLFGIAGVLFYDRRIRIDLIHGKVFFIHGIKPFREDISANMHNLKAVSINSATTWNNKLGETTAYHVDLIDNDRNAYNCYTSYRYDQMLVQFADTLSRALELSVEDTNAVEGLGHAYRKRII